MQTINALVGQAIAVRLARLGKAEKWLATEAGFKTATLNDKFNGKSSFRLSELDRIAKALGVEAVELLGLAVEEAAREVAA